MLSASLYCPGETHALDGLFYGEFGRDAELRGMFAATVLSNGETYARFDWADWPLEKAKQWDNAVRAFGKTYSLQPVQEGSPEWRAIFRGYRADPEAAEEIARIFGRHFGDRVSWVMCSKDSRGRIGARVNLRDREGREGSEQVGLDLSWNDTNVFGIGGEDLGTVRSAVDEVSEWAGRRVRPILDALNSKLKSLYGDRFRGLYVFGSYARPDAGIELPLDSDLDVALILSDFESPFEERERYGDIVADLSLEHSLVISLVPLREADFREGRTNFTRVISEYAVPVE